MSLSKYDQAKVDLNALSDETIKKVLNKYSSQEGGRIYKRKDRTQTTASQPPPGPPPNTSLPQFNPNVQARQSTNFPLPDPPRPSTNYAELLKNYGINFTKTAAFGALATGKFSYAAIRTAYNMNGWVKIFIGAMLVNQYPEQATRMINFMSTHTIPFITSFLSHMEAEAPDVIKATGQAATVLGEATAKASTRAGLLTIQEIIRQASQTAKTLTKVGKDTGLHAAKVLYENTPKGSVYHDVYDFARNVRDAWNWFVTHIDDIVFSLKLSAAAVAVIMGLSVVIPHKDDDEDEDMQGGPPPPPGPPPQGGPGGPGQFDADIEELRRQLNTLFQNIRNRPNRGDPGADGLLIQEFMRLSDRLQQMQRNMGTNPNYGSNSQYNQNRNYGNQRGFAPRSYEDSMDMSYMPPPMESGYSLSEEMDTSTTPTPASKPGEFTTTPITRTIKTAEYTVPVHYAPATHGPSAAMGATTATDPTGSYVAPHTAATGTTAYAAKTMGFGETFTTGVKAGISGAVSSTFRPITMVADGVKMLRKVGLTELAKTTVSLAGTFAGHMATTTLLSMGTAGASSLLAPTVTSMMATMPGLGIGTVLTAMSKDISKIISPVSKLSTLGLSPEDLAKEDMAKMIDDQLIYLNYIEANSTEILDKITGKVMPDKLMCLKEELKSIAMTDSATNATVAEMITRQRKELYEMGDLLATAMTPVLAKKADEIYEENVFKAMALAGDTKKKERSHFNITLVPEKYRDMGVLDGIIDKIRPPAYSGTTAAAMGPGLYSKSTLTEIPAMAASDGDSDPIKDIMGKAADMKWAMDPASLARFALAGASTFTYYKTAAEAKKLGGSIKGALHVNSNQVNMNQINKVFRMVSRGISHETPLLQYFMPNTPGIVVNTVPLPSNIISGELTGNTDGPIQEFGITPAKNNPANPDLTAVHVKNIAAAFDEAKLGFSTVLGEVTLADRVNSYDDHDEVVQMVNDAVVGVSFEDVLQSKYGMKNQQLTGRIKEGWNNQTRKNDDLNRIARLNQARKLIGRGISSEDQKKLVLGHSTSDDVLQTDQLTNNSARAVKKTQILLKEGREKGLEAIGKILDFDNQNQIVTNYIKLLPRAKQDRLINAFAYAQDINTFINDGTIGMINDGGEVNRLSLLTQASIIKEFSKAFNPENDWAKVDGNKLLDMANRDVFKINPQGLYALSQKKNQTNHISFNADGTIKQPEDQNYLSNLGNLDKDFLKNADPSNMKPVNTMSYRSFVLKQSKAVVNMGASNIADNPSDEQAQNTDKGAVQAQKVTTEDATDNLFDGLEAMFAEEDASDDFSIEKNPNDVTTNDQILDENVVQEEDDYEDEMATTMEETVNAIEKQTQSDLLVDLTEDIQEQLEHIDDIEPLSAVQADANLTETMNNAELVQNIEEQKKDSEDTKEQVLSSTTDEDLIDFGDDDNGADVEVDNGEFIDEEDNENDDFDDEDEKVEDSETIDPDLNDAVDIDDEDDEEDFEEYDEDYDSEEDDWDDEMYDEDDEEADPILEGEEEDEEDYDDDEQDDDENDDDLEGGNITSMRNADTIFREIPALPRYAFTPNYVAGIIISNYYAFAKRASFLNKPPTAALKTFLATGGASILDNNTRIQKIGYRADQIGLVQRGVKIAAVEIGYETARKIAEKSFVRTDMLKDDGKGGNTEKVLKYTIIKLLQNQQKQIAEIQKSKSIPAKPRDVSEDENVPITQSAVYNSPDIIGKTNFWETKQAIYKSAKINADFKKQAELVSLAAADTLEKYKGTKKGATAYALLNTNVLPDDLVTTFIGSATFDPTTTDALANYMDWIVNSFDPLNKTNFVKNLNALNKQFTFLKSRNDAELMWDKLANKQSLTYRPIDGNNYFDRKHYATTAKLMRYAKEIVKAKTDAAAAIARAPAPAAAAPPTAIKTAKKKTPAPSAPTATATSTPTATTTSTSTASMPPLSSIGAPLGTTKPSLDPSASASSISAAPMSDADMLALLAKTVRKGDIVTGDSAPTFTCHPKGTNPLDCKICVAEMVAKMTKAADSSAIGDTSKTDDSSAIKDLASSYGSPLGSTSSTVMHSPIASPPGDSATPTASPPPGLVESMKDKSSSISTVSSGDGVKITPKLETSSKSASVTLGHSTIDGVDGKTKSEEKKIKETKTSPVALAAKRRELKDFYSLSKLPRAYQMRSAVLHANSDAAKGLTNVILARGDYYDSSLFKNMPRDKIYETLDEWASKGDSKLTDTFVENIEQLQIYETLIKAAYQEFRYNKYGIAEKLLPLLGETKTLDKYMNETFGEKLGKYDLTVKATEMSDQIDAIGKRNYMLLMRKVAADAGITPEPRGSDVTKPSSYATAVLREAEKAEAAKKAVKAPAPTPDPAPAPGLAPPKSDDKPGSSGIKKTGGSVDSLVSSCAKCNDKNYRKHYLVGDREVLCENCVGKGIYSNRTPIGTGMATHISKTAKYGKGYMEREAINRRKNLHFETEWDKYKKTMPKNYRGGRIERQLMTKHLMYGKPDNQMLNLVATGLSLATLKHDHLSKIPEPLMANIVAGLSKLSGRSKDSDHINFSKFKSHPDLKKYIKHRALGILNNIEDEK